MGEIDTRRIAVLIDAENVPAIFADQIFEKANTLGKIVTKEMYGSGPALCSWTEPALRYVLKPTITLRQTKGKNTSDIALTIGAMDLLIADVVDDVVIVSSDSDFSALAIRLRMAGKRVIGMGELKSNAMWKVACTEFITLEQKQFSPEAQKQTTEVKPEDQQTENDIDLETEALLILQNEAHEDGYMALSEILTTLRKKYPKYLPGRRGFDKALSIFRANSHFDLRREKLPGTKTSILEIREHVEEPTEEIGIPVVDTGAEIRNRIARMLEEKNGRMPISSMFPELNTIPGYRALQKKSGKKPQQFIIDNYGDMFRTEDINGGLWTMPVDVEPEKISEPVDSIIEENETAIQAEIQNTVSNANDQLEENRSDTVTVDAVPDVNAAAEVNEKDRLAALLTEAGYISDIAEAVADIMTENKPFAAYNRMRKQFGREGGKYYNEAKALMKQL